MDRRNIEESVREAESRPMDFLPRERAVMVRDSIRRVEAMKAEGRETAEIEKEVGPFKKQFPFLYEMVMRPTYDKGTLKSMLAMLDKMGDGSMSQHQASVLVGGKLVEKYVRPTLSNA